jgi:hypothetical protein
LFSPSCEEASGYLTNSLASERVTSFYLSKERTHLSKLAYKVLSLTRKRRPKGLQARQAIFEYLKAF